MIDLSKKYTYDELKNAAMVLVGQYPDLLHLHILGMSHDGRDIFGLRLGSAGKCLICTAGIHGRESTNPVLLLKMAEDYARSAAKGQALFDQYSIYFLPVMNPDGYEIARAGFYTIRNPILRHTLLMKDMPWEMWKYNARAVDVNRNFPCASFMPVKGMYVPASENETKILISLFKKEADSVGYLDFHSRGRIIYYYRSAMPVSYNEKGKQMAEKLKSLASYDLGGQQDEMETKSDGGNSVQYYSEKCGKLAITIETVDDDASFPLDIRYQQEVYREISEIPSGFLREYDCNFSGHSL